MTRTLMFLNKSTVIKIYYALLLLPPLFGVIKAGLLGLDPWRIGEWLISYPNEFVRRGLFGEALGVLNLSGPQRVLVIALTQIIVYMPLIFYIFAHLKKSGFRRDCIALSLGPASMAFFSWDHGFWKKGGSGARGYNSLSPC